MIINQSKKTAITNSNTQQLNTLLISTAKLTKKQLVAIWLVDENSRLYCKWTTKD